jgi:sensor domain CHASE-containing protein
MILVFYDIFYLEISEKILLFLIIPVFLVLLVQTFFSDFIVFSTFSESIYN